MRRLLIAVLLTTAIILITNGCAKKVVAPIPGQVNTFDGTSYRVLMDAQAAINSVRADVVAKKITLTLAQQNILDRAIQHYNTAEGLWQAYHAGAASNQGSLQAAIQALVADISGIVAGIQTKPTSRLQLVLFTLEYGGVA